MKFLFSASQLLFACLICILFTNTQTHAQISPSDFVTTWQTDAGGSGSNQIIIPASGEYSIYYESIPAGLSGTLPEAGTFTDFQTITFPAAGAYRIAIKPTGPVPFHRIDFSALNGTNKLLTIEQWGTTAWSSMEFAYQNCDALTTLPEIDVPLLSNLTSMRFAFAYCLSLTGSSNMNNWDVSNVTNMQAMFAGATAFNQPIVDWNVSNVTIMTEMFSGAAAFNQPIGGWNVGNVTAMANMFDGTGFNQPLGDWNVSSVRSMDDMFNNATSFNQPLNSWNVGTAVNMKDMFSGATAFNQPLNNWNVSNVTNMQGMFRNATAFNQPLNSWNVSNTRDMREMFNGAKAFNRTLSNWTLHTFARLSQMLDGSGIDCGNYNSTLIGWAVNPVTPDGRSIGVIGMTYGQPAVAARDNLINNKGWTFSGDSYDASCLGPINSADFVTTWQTDNVSSGLSGPDQITIPAFGEYTVYYESIPANVSGTLPASGTFTDNQTITLPEAGTYRIAIKPVGAVPFNRISFLSGGDNAKFLTVEQWGTTVWSSIDFFSCLLLTTLPETDVPVLNNVTSMEFAFAYCLSLTGSSNMNNWDVSNVTNMRFMFESTDVFNQPIGNWNVGNVTNMESMFDRAKAFDQPIGTWNVSNVTTMFRTFRLTNSFNQPLADWDVGNVTDMGEMFSQAPSFNQPIGNWNVSNVTNMSTMFRSATAFNQPVNNWDITNVTNMQGMFMEATAFNQPLNKWTFNPNVSLNSLLNNSGIDCSNFNSTLVGWASNPATPAGRILGSNGTVYGPPAASSRDFLINSKNWLFSGGVFDPSCTSLPVTLISFDAERQEFSAQLSWSTTEEINSDRFEIQRSADTQNWKMIGTVTSSGESKVLQTYNFRDQNPVDGINYYRLRIMDLDKTFAYSRIQSVEFFKSPALSIYPNPASDRLMIGNYQRVKNIEVFNNAGVKLLENRKVNAQGIDISKLSPGLHTVKMVFIDGSFQTGKVFISR